MFNINLLEFTSPIVNSRGCIKKLKNAILKSPSDRVVINFGNIKTISRCAAQELINIKEEFQKEQFHKKKLIFSDMNKEVIKTLKLVNVKPKFVFPKIKINTQIADIRSFLC